MYFIGNEGLFSCDPFLIFICHDSSWQDEFFFKQQMGLLNKICFHIFFKAILVAFSQRELDSIAFVENFCKTTLLTENQHHKLQNKPKQLAEENSKFLQFSSINNVTNSDYTFKKFAVKTPVILLAQLKCCLSLWFMHVPLMRKSRIR